MDEILIVEDDQDIADLISIALRNEGWKSHHAPTAEDALTALKTDSFSLCILDLMLPGMDGLSFLKVLRSMTLLRDLPIIIASARDDDADIVAGLELGADDYVVKPFSPRILIARIKAVLRRNGKASPASPADADILSLQGISLDRKRHAATANGENIDFSATEFAIMEIFMKEPGRVFTREQIIEYTKGPDYPVTDRAIDVHILSIRRKLGTSASLLETIRGIGYRLRDDP